MAWGDHLDFLEGLAEETGDIPPALLDRPDLDTHLKPVWTAFWALQGDRAVSPSGLVRPIPYTAVSRWARDRGFDLDDLDRLWSRLEGLDRAYLAAESDRLDRLTKK